MCVFALYVHQHPSDHSEHLILITRFVNCVFCIVKRFVYSLLCAHTCVDRRSILLYEKLKFKLLGRSVPQEVSTKTNLLTGVDECGTDLFIPAL